MKAMAGGYARATDVQHALDLLAGADGMGRVLAGGQSLIAAMNMRLSTGDMLVDILVGARREPQLRTDHAKALEQ